MDPNNDGRILNVHTSIKNTHKVVLKSTLKLKWRHELLEIRKIWAGIKTVKDVPIIASGIAKTEAKNSALQHLP